MALGSFIAGRYSSTYNSSSLGITEQGYNVILSHQFEEIGESDAWGQSLLDLVLRGTRGRIVTNSLEYGAAGIGGAFWPHSGTLGTLGTIGRLAVGSSVAAATVLSSTAGTPAASSPASLTASRSFISQDSIDLLFNSKLRKVPMGFHMMPSDAGALFATS